MRTRPSRPASLGEALLTPTRLYVKSALEALRVGGVKGFAHITGGGITENLPRALPDGLDAEVDLDCWTPPPVFAWLAKAAGIAAHEMLRTFNCGIGLVAVVAEKSSGHVIEAFQQSGDKAVRHRATGPAAMAKQKWSIAGRSNFEARRRSDFGPGQQSRRPDLARRRPRLPDRAGDLQYRRRRRPEPRRRCRHPGHGHSAQGQEPGNFRRRTGRALRAAQIEIVCLAGFMRILSDGFARAWEGKLINIHPSLLPAYKGMRVHERVIEAGEDQSGASVHFVVPELDAGPVIAQASVPVHPATRRKSWRRGCWRWSTGSIPPRCDCWRKAK